MTRLEWNKSGERFFEAGVDRGVFFAANGGGIPWNGLVSVSETPSGGEPTPYYIDGVKYLNIAALEEYAGTIEAFTYPDRFADYDGSVELHDGLSINLQERVPFGLSYRTRVGNDLEGIEHGYKIHIIYNVLVSPSTKAYSSLGGSVDPINFSWSFTTTPVYAGNNYRRTAHAIIDSTKTSPNLVRAVEDHLYGSSARSPQLIDLEKLIYWFESGGEPLEILPHITTGMNDLIRDGKRDLVTSEVEGLHTIPSDSRLTETATPGLYTLET